MYPVSAISFNVIAKMGKLLAVHFKPSSLVLGETKMAGN